MCKGASKQSPDLKNYIVKGLCTPVLKFLDPPLICFKYCNFCPFYCKESTEWFAGLPNVKPEGIGMIGLSKGGTYTLELCRHVSKASTLVDVHEV